MTRNFFKPLVSLRDRPAMLIPPGGQAFQVWASVRLDQRFARLDDGQELDVGTTHPSGTVRASRALLVPLARSEVLCRLEISGEPAIQAQVGTVLGGSAEETEGELNFKDVEALLEKYRNPGSR